MNENYYVVTSTFMDNTDVYLTKATSEEEAINKIKGHYELNIKWNARLLNDYIRLIELGDKYAVLK